MFADYFTTLCRTDKGMVLLVIERDDETVDTRPIKTSYSPAAGTSYVQFRNAMVPMANVIGTEGLGKFLHVAAAFFSLIASPFSVAPSFGDQCRLPSASHLPLPCSQFPSRMQLHMSPHPRPKTDYFSTLPRGLPLTFPSLCRVVLLRSFCVDTAHPPRRAVLAALSRQALCMPWPTLTRSDGGWWQGETGSRG